MPIQPPFRQRLSTLLLMLGCLSALTIGLLHALPTGAAAATADAAENGPRWIDHCYDCPPLISSTSGYGAAIDSSGTLHVVYGGDGLYHSRQTADGWARELVDPALGGTQAVLAIDGGDRLHVLYETEEPERRLQYARWENGAWTLLPIPLAEVVGATQPRLALDAADRPLAAFKQAGTVYSMTYDGVVWAAEPILVGDGGIALVAKEDGTPLLAYRGADSVSLATPAGGGWSVTPVITATSGSNGGVDLSLDSGGAPHLLFDQWETSAGLFLPRYATFDGSVWQQETISGFAEPSLTEAAGLQPRLVLAPDDTPYAAFLVRGTNVFGTSEQEVSSLQVRENGQWALLTGGSGRTPMLAADGQNGVHFLWSSWPGSMTIRHWHPTAAGIVVSGGDRGVNPQLRNSRDGAIHVAAVDVAANAVRYGPWPGPEMSAAPGAFFVGPSNRQVAMAPGPAGTPIFVYGYWPQCYHCYPTIEMAAYDGTWETTPLLYDTLSSGLAAATTSDGAVHVLADTADYWTGASAVLHFVLQEAGSVGEQETVSGGRGQSVSLAADGADRLHALWVDEAGKLVYALRTAAGWTLETVVGSGNLTPALAVTAAGDPHIAVCNTLQGTVDHLFQANGSWIAEPIAAAFSDCHPAIAVDHAGRIHLSFYDQTNQVLRYAVRADSWTVTMLTTAGIPNAESAIALDPLGYPVIAFRDVTRGDLHLLTVDYARRDTFLPLVDLP